MLSSRVPPIVHAACKDKNDDAYLQRCTEKDLVLVSVCATDSNSGGDQPLPVGWDCSTSPDHQITGTEEQDGEEFVTPDCNTFDTDFAKGKDWKDIFSDVEDSSTYYGKLGFLMRAALAGGKVYFGHKSNCVLALSPVVGGGGLFGMYDSDNGDEITEITSKTTGTTADLRIFNPKVLKSAGKSKFDVGSVSALAVDTLPLWSSVGCVRTD